MKKLSVVAAIAVVILALAMPASALNWAQVGRASLLGEVKDVIDLQQKTAQYDAELRKVFALANAPTGLYDAFKRVVMAGQVGETTKAVGASFIWMGYKPAVVTVARNVRWLGGEPLRGFEVPVRFGGQIYHFFVPKKCGNVALETILPAPVAPKSPWTGHTQQRAAQLPVPQLQLVQIRPVFPAERTVPIGYGPNGPIYGTQSGFLVGPFGPTQHFIPTGPVIPPAGYYWGW